MQTMKNKRLIRCFIAISLILLFGAGDALAQQRYRIGGKLAFDVTTREQERIDVGDTKGHLLEWNRIRGTNTSTGGDTFMDGAQVDLMGLSDTVMGNGMHMGYLKMSLEGDSVYFKLEGEILTTTTPEGSSSEDLPTITFESTYTDTFSIIQGTGKYQGIQGVGFIRGEVTVKVEKGELVSRTGTVEWRGTAFIKK